MRACKLDRIQKPDEDIFSTGRNFSHHDFHSNSTGNTIASIGTMGLYRVDFNHRFHWKIILLAVIDMLIDDRSVDFMVEYEA